MTTPPTAATADVIITGEGQMNYQSVLGKVPVEVAKVGKKYPARVIAVVGSKGEGYEKAMSAPSAN